MYTEGYIIEIFSGVKKSSFTLEPTSPYKFRLGESDYTLEVDVKSDAVRKVTIENKGPQKPWDAKIVFKKVIELTCTKSVAEFASLVAIKASHTRIGVEFGAKETVSKIVVL